MDANQDEYLLSCYLQWARDAGVSETISQLTEKEARKDLDYLQGKSTSEKFYSLIRHVVAPDSPMKGHA